MATSEFERRIERLEAEMLVDLRRPYVFFNFANAGEEAAHAAYMAATPEAERAYFIITALDPTRELRGEARDPPT